MTINRETLEYLAGLSRIKLGKRKEEKLLKDLKEILDYFEELKALDTSSIEPMTGGTSLENVFREDQPRDKRQVTSDKLVEDFPEKENNFLKVPAIFE